MITQQLVQTFLEKNAIFGPDFEETYAKVSQSKAIYKGKPVPYLHIPMIYTEEDVKTFEYALEGMMDIVETSIALYMEKDVVRSLYGFDSKLEALILLPHDYKTMVPMGRFDIFYYGPGQFMFCELNTDGASAMNEELELTQILSQTQLMKRFANDYDFNSFELFHSWVKEVKKIYKEFQENRGLNNPKPFVAIVDFMDKSSPIEFNVFKETFLEANFSCNIVDPRDISCEGGFMKVDGQIIDVVYRRLVTKDMMDRYDEIPGFIEGIKANKTCLIGSIKSQVVHTKRFFEVLHEPSFRQYLTSQQLDFIDQHVPYTRALQLNETTRDYIANKDAYIIKPVDYYASKGVSAGKDYTAGEWEALLEEKQKEDFIVQAYCPLALTENVLSDGAGGYTQETFSTITGLFTYNKVFSGLYVRAGLNSIISGLHDGFTMSSLLVTEPSKGSP